MLLFSQQKQFSIEWNGSKSLETAYDKTEIPSFEGKNFSFNPEKGLFFFSEWSVNTLINEETASLQNIRYSSITRSDLKDLDVDLLPGDVEFKIKNINARGKRSVFLEMTPIINDNGTFKKVESFSVNYSTASSSRNGLTASRYQAITNSVLRDGDWYRFYLDTSGVHRISRSFLNQLGISSGDLNPSTIKIYGNGGNMLPLLNSVDYPIDLVENAIQVVGGEDGSFDADDYILFYAQGPQTFSSESNTNLNLYTDKTYYYVNISSGNGKRIQSMPDIQGDANQTIDTFDDYRFYEVDDFNLAKLGRRWFGDKFDIQNQRVYNFDFPNLVTTEDIRLTVAVGSVSATPTSMGVSLNGASVSNLNLPTVDLSSATLASAASFSGLLSVSSGDIQVNLTYSNNGNPSSNAYLDYINIEAVRSLLYAGEQLTFRKNSVANDTGIIEYSLGNANNVSQVWDITDRFNVTMLSNADSASQLSFKANAGEVRDYIAFANNDLLEPKRDNNVTVQNQNLKGTIFLDNQGQFEDIDYLILTPSELQSQAERLAQINRNQYGLTVKVVPLHLIYNEFSSGNQDIAALRNFVRYVYNNASTPENRIKYLGLFGDASYDYKDRIPNNTNLVPSWFSNASFSLVSSFIADDFFGIMDEDEGSLGTSDRMDIAVGRIVADDLETAKIVVDKIEGYYQKEAFGSWRNNVLLISDDVDLNWEGILQQTTDDIATDVEAQKSFFNVTKVHSDAFQQEASAGGERYPDAKKAIRDAIEVGALVTNYFGHGGEDGLAAERIFDKNDAREINNICKFTCFITVTCEYTKFDDPQRETAGEFTFWNKNGGAVSLITTTRQIFVQLGTAYNEILEDYLFAYGSTEFPSIAEALRQTKLDPQISGSFQKRLVCFVGDPAMKLTVPQPNIRLTHINDVPVSQTTDVLESLSKIKMSGEVTDVNGNVLSNYNGILTATIFDKPIDRTTLANDGTRDTNGNLITLDFTTLGETIFKGQATVTNGVFDFNFVVPRDIGIPVGNGKVSFYAQSDVGLEDQTGASYEIQVGGINENAEEDNIGPVINLFMNDENFVSGGITNESPTLLVKLQDSNGINTASGIGHDITAILDGDETNPFVLNDYYVASVDDYTTGELTYPFRDLEPGLHTLTVKAWDVYNNSSISEIQFMVFDNSEALVIDNVLNYPNPFVNYTEFWFNHNSSDVLDISVQIFTVSGKLVRTINGQTNTSGKSTSTLSRDIIWDGRDDFGDKIGKGVYVYKLKVKSQRLNKQVEKIQKLVIL
ncbi:type IX secretion system sortase PorU [Winogradskyella sp. A3E31]|uniref:type IX secretion system sortase PorU n=1 Tax=Winogradskyella sp. A3E31 TaxID=3349637 RepID=UPI00398BA6D5